MADVKWIKIVVDVFDDEKILLIESMPDADSIITIWFKLLCLAGKNNNSGVFLLNEKIPYTDEMISTIFRRNINTVRLALNTFERFGMVEIVNGVITIPNWGKHQSLDQIESKREYQRKYMLERRKKQRLLAEGKGECKANSKSNSKSNVSSIEGEVYKEELYKEEPDKNKIKDKKSKYGEYSRVLLTPTELFKLSHEYSNHEELIKFLDEYIEMKGYKAKSHYLAIKKWVVDAVKERKNKKQGEQSSNVFTEIGRDMGIW